MNFMANESEQKLRGGYYTPEDLAAFISKWATRHSPTTVLEPSCGDGVFFDALVRSKRDLNVLGFEVFPEEAAKARERVRKHATLKCEVRAEDFLDYAINRMLVGEQPFGAVVGNPPFIRYQYLPAEAQRKAEAIFQLLRLPFTKHTNAWVPFVMAAIALLKPGGRLGMILPAEIIHVMHAQSLRTFLGASCTRLLIIDPEELWFDGTLQGAVILLAEKKLFADQHCEGLGIIPVSGRAFVKEDPARLFDNTERINGKTVEGKWTRALLTVGERKTFDALCEHQDVSRFEDIADVDVGIVTGANKFFLVDDATVEKYKLSRFVHPMFGRSEHCPGVIYDSQQHQRNAKQGNPTNFVWLKLPKPELPKRVLEYVQTGERDNLHTRYKCRIRKPWYMVPSVYSTPVSMLKRSSDTPRLILNRLEAFTTDTAYRVQTMDGLSAERLVYCFLNALTALSAELEGRHYGGGVLELVPSEIEKLLIPLPTGIQPELRQLDNRVRSDSVQDVLDRQSRVILGAIGLESSKQDDLLQAWLRLKNRRQRISAEDN